MLLTDGMLEQLSDKRCVSAAITVLHSTVTVTVTVRRVVVLCLSCICMLERYWGVGWYVCDHEYLVQCFVVDTVCCAVNPCQVCRMVNKQKCHVINIAFVRSL